MLQNHHVLHDFRLLWTTSKQFSLLHTQKPPRICVTRRLCLSALAAVSANRRNKPYGTSEGGGYAIESGNFRFYLSALNARYIGAVCT